MPVLSWGDKPPISVSDSTARMNAPTMSVDSYTKGLGTTDPQKPYIKICCEALKYVYDYILMILQ